MSAVHAEHVRRVYMSDTQAYAGVCDTVDSCAMHTPLMSADSPRQREGERERERETERQRDRECVCVCACVFLYTYVSAAGVKVCSACGVA